MKNKNKNRKKNKAATVLLMIVNLMVSASIAHANSQLSSSPNAPQPLSPRGQEGGAGRYKGQHFSATAHAAFQVLAIGEPDWKYENFAKKVADIEAIPKEGICFMDLTTGVEICQDGWFIPGNPAQGKKPVIKFDYPEYGARTCIGRMAMALHEYLRAAGIEGNDYTYSGRFLNGNWTKSNYCMEQASTMTPAKAEECNQIAVARIRKNWDACASLDAAWPIAPRMQHGSSGPADQTPIEAEDNR